MGERIGRVKVRKLVGWDKDSLIAKAKVVQASKAKQGIHSLLPTGGQVFSHLQESRAPSRITVTWGDKCHHSEHPPLPSSYPSFIAEHSIVQCGISLWSVGVSCPHASAHSLCNLSLLTGGVG